MADGKDKDQQDRGRGFEELDEVLIRLRDNGREFMEAASSRIAELRKRDVQDLGNQFTTQAREMFDSAVNLLQMVPDIINRLGARGEETDQEPPSPAQAKGKTEEPEPEPAAASTVTDATSERRAATKAGKAATTPEKSAKKAEKAEKPAKSTEKSATSSASAKKAGGSPEKAGKSTKKAGKRASTSGESSG